MAPYIVGFVVNGNNEAFHEALAIKQICHRAGIDFVIRRIPKGSRWSADLYIKAAKEDVGVHGFIFFGHLVRTHLDHAKADTLPSASRPLKYLHDYLHLIWRNMRFADDVAEASRRQHTSTSRPRHLAFVGDAENTQRLGLLQETWPNRLRNCKVCLLNPSNFAGCLLASRLVGDGAEVFCINDNAVDIARKEQGGTLHSASLNEQKLADVMAGCHFIVRDDLHTETERLQQLPNGSAQIVLPSWDALDRAVEQDLNLQLRTEKALDMSILMTNLRVC